MYSILIAPNSFKGSLTADQAAEAIEQGLKQSKLKFIKSLDFIYDYLKFHILKFSLLGNKN